MGAVSDLCYWRAWILYQFNKLRQDAEEKLEDYLSKHLDQKRQKFEQERREMFARILEDQMLSMVGVTIRRARAQIWRFVYGLRRFIPFLSRPSPKRAAILLFDAGKKLDARNEFNRHARDLLKQAKIYEDQANAKKLEAGNSFLFAGRVAAQAEDKEGTREAFNAVLSEIDPNDIDAHELIGEQYRESNLPKAALNEFEVMATLATTANNRAKLAKALRLQADIHQRLSSLGRARQALRDSLQIATAERDERGLAETYEALGNLYAAWQPPAKRRAKQSFDLSREHYRSIGDEDSAIRVDEGLLKLEKKQVLKDWWLSRLLAWIGEFILGVATRLRVQAHTT